MLLFLVSCSCSTTLLLCGAGLDLCDCSLGCFMTKAAFLKCRCLLLHSRQESSLDAGFHRDCFVVVVVERSSVDLARCWRCLFTLLFHFSSVLHLIMRKPLTDFTAGKFFG